MEKQGMPFGLWLLALAGAIVAGLVIGGVLLGPPGAAALSAAFGRGVYASRPKLTDQR